jgi:hypothetical protein
MMHPMPLGHRLETLHDGLTTFRDGSPTPIPLQQTTIDVSVRSGLATVRTTRLFRNEEDAPIEAVMTFPVGFDAVLCGLAATIEGRRLVAVAKDETAARESYETGLDEGRMSILHEELLRGIHMLSVGAVPPGAAVEVELEQVVPLSNASGVPFLRLPMTAGQIYGSSPFLPADDLVTSTAVRHEAILTVEIDQGTAVLEGHSVLPGEAVTVLLDHAIELRIENGLFGNVTGRAADGRKVAVSLSPIPVAECALDLHVLVDRSGSTNVPIRGGGCSVWEAMRDGLAEAFDELNEEDQITLWQFDTSPQCLGNAEGGRCTELVTRLEPPGGGTELADAVRAALQAGARDLLVLTDGQTWAHMVDDLKRCEARISAILAGPHSLDANIGHLCSLTGGQVFFAPGREIATALRTALASSRQQRTLTEGTIGARGPDQIRAFRGGVQIDATWMIQAPEDDAPLADSIGRFAAAFALSLLDGPAASAWARAHTLCTHSTSLVLVDEEGSANEGFARVRKVPLMAAPERLFAADFIAPRSGSGLPTPEALARMRPAIAGHKLTHQPRNEKRSDEKRWSFLEGFFKRRKGKANDTVALFQTVAWDTVGDAFLASDFRSLCGDQWMEVERLARRISKDDRYSQGTIAAPINEQIIALGLIARKLGTRVSRRFARKALQEAPEWVLELLP